jgi:hypothetical protein
MCSSYDEPLEAGVNKSKQLVFWDKRLQLAKAPVLFRGQMYVSQTWISKNVRNFLLNQYK